MSPMVKPMSSSHLYFFHYHPAISHAMSRDGSSGGVIRMAIITKDGVERKYIPGDKLPFMKDD